MARPRQRLERNCQDCGNWLLERKTTYDDGSEIVTYEAPEGKGNCQILKTDTLPDFGSNSFEYGNHIETINKSGAPWQHWHFDTCPTCNGRGNSGDINVRQCDQCWGTGRVRYYDDGFIGDEKIQLHPNEKEPLPVPEITLKKIDGKEGVL
jgi:hypothetical protein